MVELQEFIWQISGQQGEGIDSAGDILAEALNSQGYYLYGYREFSSRIKGGHTDYRLRISHTPVGAISHKLHLLIALDQKTLDVSEHSLVHSSIIIADEGINISPIKDRHRVIIAPLSEIASRQGKRIVKNMVSLGISIAIMHIDPRIFDELISERFKAKGQEIINLNINALKAGYSWAKENNLAGCLPLKAGDGEQRLFMIGNQAAALGALMAGCRFISAYPITPASEIMEYLGKKLMDFGGTAVQTEDEIAAITMAIGASYAGARAMTATSGPGLSLMTEAIGLAGMTETPIVILDAQRGGPSTGLPTKHEQSDLLSAIFGTHGEIPKVVFTPATVAQCFYQTAEAFNIAEQYQCPVIVLSDVALSLGKQTVEPFSAEKIIIRRGEMQQKIIEPLEEGELFRRYMFTASGISPRPLPGVENGVHQLTGLEHDETGLPSENPALRTAMMDKRLNKLPELLPNSTFYFGPDKPEYLLIGYGSTYGPIAEARQLLADDRLSIGHLQLLIAWPFPIAEMDYYLDAAKKVFIVENNATGQLQRLLNMFSPYDRKMKLINKYNGRPFIPWEIYETVKGVL